MNPRQRTVLYASIGFVAVWLVAAAGFAIARNSQVTADKVHAYLDNTDLRLLSGEKRAQALRELSAKISSLSAEERRKFRRDRMMKDWFDQMTEEEKGAFIEETMPSGFKQMIAAFEQMPEDKRRKAVDDAMKRLKEPKQDGERAQTSTSTDKEPELSEELQQKVATIGLKSFYSQSSAQTKAELAPLMEEIQKSMESGRAFRGR